MKKFFIFLFAVFLITFMGCNMNAGESPEIPTSETTEETTEEAFEIFALDEANNILTDDKGNRIGIDQINKYFSRKASYDQNFVQPLFYKNIKINSKVYTVKGLNTCTINNISIKNIPIKFLPKYNLYYFDKMSDPLGFIDFYIGKSICFEDGTTLSFSDLYEMKK